MRGKGDQGLAIVQIVKLTKPEVEMGVKVGNEQLRTGGSMSVQGKLIEHPKNIGESGRVRKSICTLELQDIWSMQAERTMLAKMLNSELQSQQLVERVEVEKGVKCGCWQ
jgi:hypothetical protein